MTEDDRAWWIAVADELETAVWESRRHQAARHGGTGAVRVEMSAEMACEIAARIRVLAGR